MNPPHHGSVLWGSKNITRRQTPKYITVAYPILEILTMSLPYYVIGTLMVYAYNIIDSSFSEFGNGLLSAAVLHCRSYAV